MNAILLACSFLRALLVSRLSLAAENLALRHQLTVLLRQKARPRLRQGDRFLWVWLSRLWRGWRSALLLVRPGTVIAWHRQGFAWYWRWKSRSRIGRPPVDAELRWLIRRLSRDNPTWGTPRIKAELHLLGYSVAKATIDKYRIRSGKPPSPSWKVFLATHVGSLVSIDFCVVPTVTFALLYVFLVLRHDRRRVVHFGITTHPSSEWAARQITAAFPFDQAPRYLIRDRDGVYGQVFRRQLQSLGIEEVVIAPRSPWQNPYAERLVGSIRRECLDHFLVWGATHLRRLLSEYFAYYHEARSHRSLGQNSPDPREVEPPDRGRVVATSHVGGLHHRYRRVA